TDDAATLLLGTSVLSSLKGGGLRQAEDPVNPLQPSPILSTKPGQLHLEATATGCGTDWLLRTRKEGDAQRCSCDAIFIERTLALSQPRVCVHCCGDVSWPNLRKLRDRKSPSSRGH